MYSSNKLVLHILSLLKQNNVKHIVISPGSRHYPLIRSMENDNYFKLYSVVDERSAGFFALGLIQNLGNPVAICCTSGTSAINYGSAVIEAFYQNLPLVVLTADRLPELLNQKEEQMFKQDKVYDGFIKYSGQLKEVNDAFSEWYSNRIINEAFLELYNLKPGPIHLNIPIENHRTDKFLTPNIPLVRKISKIYGDSDINSWDFYRNRLQGKKILIVWGQSFPTSKKLTDAINLFCKQFNCVILKDKLSNFHHESALDDSLAILTSLSQSEKDNLKPDIIITVFGNYVFNNDFKRFVKHFKDPVEHWDIGTNIVCDPFKILTTIFSVNESYFFQKMGEGNHYSFDNSYFIEWNKISLRIKKPVLNFGEFSAIGQLLSIIPKNSNLLIANSLPIRMSQFFNLDPSINVYCNRGVNGIDGCMSTAVGFASISEELVFLIIGDLTFFYDVNALWNRHLSKKIRILLLNNEGGGVMHLPLNENLAPQLNKHVSAGHISSSEGLAKSLGLKYMSSVTSDDFQDNLTEFVNDESNEPMILEVFTKKEDDVVSYKNYLKQITTVDSISFRIKRKVIQKFNNILPR